MDLNIFVELPEFVLPEIQQHWEMFGLPKSSPLH